MMMGKTTSMSLTGDGGRWEETENIKLELCMTTSSVVVRTNMNIYKYAWVREGAEVSSERWQRQKRPQVQIL